LIAYYEGAGLDFEEWSPGFNMHFGYYRGGNPFRREPMQKNCHEFIAYENLVGTSRGGRAPERGGRPAATSDISKALPIVMRALKVLSEREVTPQLGLLKSTLLQLDSTFSEREYGAGSFRDFMEKVAQTGAVTLKHAGRSMLVEVHEEGSAEPQQSRGADHQAERVSAPAARATSGLPEDEDEESMPASPMTMQDGIRAVQQAINRAPTPPRWPMYVRQAKQFLRGAIENFDERHYGFASVVDLLRAAGKEGVLRIERDRQGAVRVFPGANLAPRPVAPPAEEPVDLNETIDVEVPAAATVDSVETEQSAPAPPIVEGEPVQEVEEPVAVAEVVVEERPEKPKRGRSRKTAGPRATRTRKPRAH
jgi:hypothetical protein